MMSLLVYLQQVVQVATLPPVEDVVRWAFYGIVGWIAVQTWGNGKSLSFLKGGMVTRDVLSNAIDRVRDDVTSVLTNYQDRTDQQFKDTNARINSLTERRSKSR